MNWMAAFYGGLAGASVLLLIYLGMDFMRYLKAHSRIKKIDKTPKAT